MSYGADKWKAGDSLAGSLRSAQVMRFYGLSKMLEAAELAARLGSKAEAVEHLRRLPFPASGPVKKDDPNVDIETYSFLTTTPNPLVATINHERMPVLLTREEEFETWLSGSPDDALGVAHEYEPDHMRIVQEGFDSFAATASYAFLGRDESGVADNDGSVPRTHGP